MSLRSIKVKHLLCRISVEGGSGRFSPSFEINLAPQISSSPLNPLQVITLSSAEFFSPAIDTPQLSESSPQVVRFRLENLPLPGRCTVLAAALTFQLATTQKIADLNGGFLRVFSSFKNSSFAPDFTPVFRNSFLSNTRAQALPGSRTVRIPLDRNLELAGITPNSMISEWQRVNREGDLLITVEQSITTLLAVDTSVPFELELSYSKPDPEIGRAHV